MALPEFGQQIGRLEQAASDGGAGDGWILVEDITAPANAQQIDITDLDGDAHELYMLILSIENPSGSDALHTIRFNGDGGANYNHQFGVHTGGGALAGRTLLDISIDISYLISAGEAAIWRGLIAAASGKERKMVSDAHNTATISHSLTFSEWINTIANLTQISIISDNPGTIGAGSRLWLYRPAS